MSDDVIISVEKLSKKYRLGQIGATSLRESAERLWNRLRAKRKEQRAKGDEDSSLSSTRLPLTACRLPLSQGEGEELWALKDVSFEVKRGEVLGIIGRNVGAALHVPGRSFSAKPGRGDSGNITEHRRNGSS